MKRIIIIVFVALGVYWIAGTLKLDDPPSLLRAERGAYRGWNAVWLSNGLVTVHAVPDIGGRIMQYTLGNHPYLYVYKKLEGVVLSAEENNSLKSFTEWLNYGGDKTWPAPQRKWKGPPDPVLDSGRFASDLAMTTDGRPKIVMTSPDGASAGIRVTREISLYEHSSRMTLNVTMANTADSAQSWSIWNVTQIHTARIGDNGEDVPDTDARFFVPLSGHSRFPRGFQVLYQPAGAAVEQWNDTAFPGLMMVDYKPVRGKIGLDCDQGWIASTNRRDSYTLVQCFSFDPARRDDYPDGGMSAEIWVNAAEPGVPPASEHITLPYVETEILSPMQRMAPGESFTFAVDWFAARCPFPIVEVAAGGCTSVPLTMSREGAITGIFGVFYTGRAELLCVNVRGETTESFELGEVSPNQPVQVAVTTTSPSDVQSLQLIIHSPLRDEPFIAGRTDL